ncbi:trichodiene oxygenase [Camillea tinctor]|nr:trichodiene oxygenase [Camillea tinctor]
MEGVLSNSSSPEKPQSLLASIGSPNSIELLTKVTWRHVVVAVVVYYANLASYRLYLHPLAKSPGPKIAAISRWYEAHYDLILDGQYTFKFEKMHKQYGPDKYAWSYDAFGVPLSAVSCSPHDLDAVSGTQKTINLGLAISAFTRDASTNFIIGKSYNNLDKEDFNQAMTKTIVGLRMLWRITKHIRWVGPLLLSLPTSIAKATGDEGNKAFFVFLENSRNDTKNIMKASMAENPDPNKPHTLVHDIMKSRLPEAEKRLDHLGPPTGAILHEAGTADLSVSSLEQLPYLTAVIMEGLRLSPSVASRLARVAPDRDLFYDKWCIPKGTPVEMSKKSEKTFAPFSRGTRNCIGMHLAWAELYLVTSAIIMRFDFKFDGAGPKDVEIVSDQFIVGVSDASGIKAWVTRYGV